MEIFSPNYFTTFCAQYIEEISSLYHNGKEGRFAEFHGIFQEALTEKTGSQVLDEIKILG